MGYGQPIACAAVLQPVPISCHFRGCKAPLSSNVSGAIQVRYLFTFTRMRKKSDDIFSHFDTTHQYDGQMDARVADKHWLTASNKLMHVASHDNNRAHYTCHADTHSQSMQSTLVNIPSVEYDGNFCRENCTPVQTALCPPQSIHLEREWNLVGLPVLFRSCVYAKTACPVPARNKHFTIMCNSCLVYLQVSVVLSSIQNRI